MGISNYLLKKASGLLFRRSVKWQRKSKLRDLRLWDLNANTQGYISVAGE